MEKCIQDMATVIKNADDTFEESILSEELYRTCDIGADHEEESDEDYLRSRIYGETGVNMRSHSEIFELFSEKAELLYTTIHDLYYFNEQYKVSDEYALEDKAEWQLFCRIECKACEEYCIDILISLTIDDEMEEDSELGLRYVVYEDGKEIRSDYHHGCIAAIHYHNGSGLEDIEEGKIMLHSESATDESEQDDFLENLDAAISNLSPYVKELKDSKYENMKEGTESPVADFPCWECGNHGASIRDDFYKFGHCCYCGSDNEVDACMRCGTYFNGDGGRDHLCENCIEKMEDE